MNKVPFIYRGLLGLVVAALHALSVLAEWYTSLALGIVLGVIAGWVVNGLLYGTFAAGEAIKATPGHLRDSRSNQPGASSPRSRAIGYWIMTAILIAGGIAIPIAKKFME